MAYSALSLLTSHWTFSSEDSCKTLKSIKTEVNQVLNEMKNEF